ncbi:MAG: hypothetical protein ACXQS8_01225 [Candidatus Helarchaeales archaeon]
MQGKKISKYNTLKIYQGKKYSGMSVGSRHSWNYNNGIWNETKIEPDKWIFTFTCNKERIKPAPPRTGALVNTEYHWYIIADQKVRKLNENVYSTTMNGIKFKIGHKRPNWHKWSYEYDNEPYEIKLIQILKDVIKSLEERLKKSSLTRFF